MSTITLTPAVPFCGQGWGDHDHSDTRGTVLWTRRTVITENRYHGESLHSYHGESLSRRIVAIRLRTLFEYENRCNKIADTLCECTNRVTQTPFFKLKTNQRGLQAPYFIIKSKTRRVVGKGENQLQFENCKRPFIIKSKTLRVIGKGESQSQFY